MVENTRKPVIGVPVSININEQWGTRQHSTGEQYIMSMMQGAGGAPMLIPALGEMTDFEAVLGVIDGLMLTGGRANIEPHHYGGPAFPDDEPIDPRRDSTVLPLIRGCVDRGIPVFGICRGIQEINVALGGTLHYRVHVLPGRMDHRMRRDLEQREDRYALRHAVALAPGSLCAELAGAEEVWTNSLHAQGVDRPAPGMLVEGLCSDGVIEVIRLDEDDRFCVGVQWHAEWRIEDHTLSRRLFERFGDAARAYAARRKRQPVR